MDGLPLDALPAISVPPRSRRSLLRGAAGAGVAALIHDISPVAAMGTPEPPGPEILWDSWGVPHIFAQDAAGLLYAFGWAQMHNHGDLLLRLYARARGRAAEVFGVDALASDLAMRTMGLPARGRIWYQAQSDGFRTNVDAFAAGINAYADQHGTRLDHVCRAVLPVTGEDVFAHLARVLYLFLAGESGTLSSAPAGSLVGSNGWAIAPSRTRDGHALLLANPHLVWAEEHTFFEAQLQAPGSYDAYGATLVGLPVLAIAFTEDLGWTHTNNTIDTADLYRLILDGDGYRFDGQIREFEQSTETLLVRQDDGSLRDEMLTVRRSVHGPVFETTEGETIAVRVAGVDAWSSAAGALEQWWDMARATNFAEFDAVVRRLQLPFFHIIYADQAGHIQLLFNGHSPVRPEGDSDWTTPVPGDTSALLWTEIRPYDDLPRVVDPPGGWVQNSNSPPWYAAYPPALDPEDFPDDIAPRYLTFREQRGIQMLQKNPQLTLERLEELQYSTRMELADRMLDELVAAARQSTDAIARRAADVLAAWDRQALPQSTGTLLFLAWVPAMEPVDGLTLADLFRIPWDPEEPLTTPRQLKDPNQAVQALRVAADQVEARFGRLDVPWGEVARLRRGEADLPANGAPGDPYGVFRVLYFDESHLETTRQMDAFGGDSYVAAIEFSDPVRTRVLLTYGNASQSGSPHVGDQLALSASGEMRTAWRTRQEIDAHLQSREVLTLPVAPEHPEPSV